jgi:hypothetical protein
MAEYLRSDAKGSLRAMAIMNCEEWTWLPWGNLLKSVKFGESSFEHFYGISLFEFFKDHPEAGAIFDEAMTGFSEQTGPAVAAAYDFSGINVVVDVGGGEGALVAAILKGHPALRGILFDQPEAVERARGRLAAEGLTERCQIVAGSFFESVPGDGQAYILSHIIHDWDEPRATTILQNCHTAMGSKGRLLLVENVIPPGNTPYFGKLLDLEMLTMAAGRERTEAEYRDLFATSGFKLTRIVPTATPNSVIEGVPV